MTCCRFTIIVLDNAIRNFEYNNVYDHFSIIIQIVRVKNIEIKVFTLFYITLSKCSFWKSKYEVFFQKNMLLTKPSYLSTVRSTQYYA